LFSANGILSVSATGDTLYLANGAHLIIPGISAANTSGGSGQYPVGSVFCNGPTAIVDVTNPATGKIWMDRNLGASQAATSSTDANAYGDLYQWGRRSDGHQCRNSATTTTLSSTDQPANGDFIIGAFDWRSPQNDNLWQGVNGVNNPCPSGYRLPTYAELDAERASWSSNNSAGAFASPLKLPVAGVRSNSYGSLDDVGSNGDYWSSAVNGTIAYNLYFGSSDASMYNYYRAFGLSVRCLKYNTASPQGSINSIDCGNATNSGTLILGTEASGVSSSVPYTGGNGGTYNAQIITSTGVTGLTATLTAGTFANGSGSLTYTITGTPASSGTAGFALSIGGQTCTLSLTVNAGGSGQYPVGSVFCNGPTAIVDVTNPATGKIWMDRNLGASQVATSSTDANAYGDLYQWGRRSDGHQCRNSATTTTLSSTDQPSHGNFILAPNSPFDWRSPGNNNLWQGVNGVNNPCPGGYRLPTNAELDAERVSWSSNNSAGAFASPLKLPVAGYRDLSAGSLYNVGSLGHYWSSTVNGSYASNLDFLSSNAYMIDLNLRAYGVSVRCLKDNTASPQGSINSIDCGNATNNGTLTSGTVASGVSSSVPYTGGNGGTHNGQTVTSTGVTGLTATLPAGTFASGSDSLTYTISGTPASSGTASFAVSIGGQSCTLSRTVALPVGSITALNCGSASNNGTLTTGTAASGVSSSVPYTGGNGGTYSAQSVSSTGVTGLTATIPAGTFASGSGSITYTITGTPASSGTASFAVSIGGQSCTLSRTVALPVGSITALNCGSASNNGTLTTGTAASGVSSSIPYTGGNGGTYSAQSVSSTGVTGLTATIPAGTFASGSGSITYTITGTPASSGTASFALSIGGQICSLPLTVYGIQPVYPVGSVFCNGVPTIVNDVTNPTTGRIWMDRNLGASQAATSSTDANAYGDLYQWGRRSDGHQCRNSATTSTLSSSDQPAHGSFILAPNPPFDWRSPLNDNLWQGVNGVNNPCPNGYRLPTFAELDAERVNWSSNTSAGAFASPLKLPVAGSRLGSNGSLHNVGSGGYYWSSTVTGTDAYRLFFYSSNANMFFNGGRAPGFSVRCLKVNTSSPQGSINSIDCGSASNSGTLTSDTAASGVSSSVPYTGGNGGTHNGQTVTSTGVTGLTATLPAGTFANGSGSLTYTISGTPASSGTASFALSIGGQTCTLSLTVNAGGSGQYPVGSVFCNGPTAVVDVTNPATGKIWMDRNLGALQSPSSITDTMSQGDFYQWGRGVDGHQCRNSSTIGSPSSSDFPGHSFFILSPNNLMDWRTSQNNNLWQGLNGINNPCPNGYRLPTTFELESERMSWTQNNNTGAHSSPLKLTPVRARWINGLLFTTFQEGYYWSSTIIGANAGYLFFSMSAGLISQWPRGGGMSIRCIKN
jgi:hypothetical protein